MELRDECQVNVPQINIDKIMAAISVITSDDFFKNLPRFIQLCNVLAGDEFNPRVFDPADSAEMAWAITEALLLSPPDEDEPFCDEIRYYIGAVLKDEGVVNPPDVLRIAMSDVPVSDPLAGDVEDPTMYSAFYGSQQSKSAEITDMLQRQIAELFAELEAITLREGNNKELFKRMQEGALNEGED